MNTAIIFAGGTGTRMNAGGIPKQFLELNGKPIIIHTLEHFEHHPDIDNIAVVCIEDWIERFRKMLDKFGIQKVKWIIPGGKTSQESTRNGLYAVAADQDPSDTVVLIHDGVRPLINDKLISDNIESVRAYGNAITTAPAIETVITCGDGNEVLSVIDRSICRVARAPQSFYLSDIITMHEQAIKDGYDEMIDSATLFMHYGVKLYIVEGPSENIKITTPSDYFMFKGMLEIKENMRILGV